MSESIMLKLIIRDDEGEAIYTFSLDGLDLTKLDTATRLVLDILEAIDHDEAIR